MGQDIDIRHDAGSIRGRGMKLYEITDLFMIKSWQNVVPFRQKKTTSAKVARVKNTNNVVSFIIPDGVA